MSTMPGLHPRARTRLPEKPGAWRCDPGRGFRSGRRPFALAAAAILLFSLFDQARWTAAGETGGEAPTGEVAVRGRLLLKGPRQPLRGFRVELRRGWETLAATTTDMAGEFEFGGLRAGSGEAEIVMVPPVDIYTAPGERVGLDGEDRREEVTILAECAFKAPSVARLTWEGEVLQAEGGGPVEGARAALRREGRLLGERRTDGTGAFRFADCPLPPGPYELAVETGNELLPARTLRVVLGELDHVQRDRVALESPLGLPLARSPVFGRVLVRKAPGILAGNATVRCVTGGFVVAETRAHADGSYQMKAIYAPPGGVYIEAEPALFLLRGSRILWFPSRSDNGDPIRRAEVALTPGGGWWVSLAAAPLLLAALLALGFRYWVLPEWRTVRSRMRSHEGSADLPPGERK